MFEGDTSWWTGVFEIVVDNSLEFVVLALIAGGLTQALRRRDPRIRHAVWLVALLWLAVPVDPPLPWSAGGGQTMETAAGRLATTWSNFDRAWLPALVAEPPQRAAEGPRDPGQTAVAEPEPSSTGAGSAQRSAAPSRASGGSLWNGLASMWGLGVALSLGWLGVRGIQTRRLRRRGRVDPDLVRISESLRQSLNLRRVVPVLRIESRGGRTGEGESEGGPSLVGLVNPVILMPAATIETWERDELRAAIAHELAHVARLDHWISWLQRLLTAIFFFHPMVWWATRRLAFERELCCDDQVMARAETHGRPYLNALLNSATRNRLRAPVLGVAGHHSNVSRRIRRMTDNDYQSKTTRPPIAVHLVAILFLLAGMVVAGAPRSATDDARSAPGGRIGGIIAYPSYFSVGASGEVDWDRALPVNGDIEIGRPDSSIGLSEIEIAPELSGELDVRVRVAPDGVLHDVELIGSLDPGFDGQLLDRVRAAEWRSSRHKQLGPVGMEMVLQVRVHPADLARDLRPSMGEVAEALPYSWTSDSPGPGPETPSSPTYLPVRTRPEFAAEASSALAGDYSFALEILEDGRVGTVEFLGTTVPHGVQSNNWESLGVLRDEFVSWVRDFTFDPPIDGHGVRRQQRAFLDVRVDDSGVRLATFAPTAETWRPALEPIYRLEENQAVKLIPQAEIEGLLAARVEMYRTFDARRGRGRVAAPSVLHLEWADGELSPKIEGACHGGCELFSSGSSRINGEIGAALRGIPFMMAERFEVLTGEGEDVRIGPGDVIWRRDATREQVLTGLASELGRILDVPVRWEDASSLQTAIVLRGQLAQIVEEPAVPGERMLHVYRDEKEPDPRSGSGFAPATDGETLARALEMFLRMPVVDETIGAPVDRFTVRMHRSAWTDATDEVAANIAAQTGLEVVLEERPVDVTRLVVGESAGSN